MKVEEGRKGSFLHDLTGRIQPFSILNDIQKTIILSDHYSSSAKVTNKPI